MEPLLTDMEARDLEFRRLTGIPMDTYKVPLAIFLHVNDLDEFQRTVIPMFMDPGYKIADLTAANLAINRYIAKLRDSNWSPVKPSGDMVNQPKHYARFPIEPTFFNRENGIDWNRGNALKYICRYGFKNGLEDLAKAVRYLALEIRYLQQQAGWSK